MRSTPFCISLPLLLLLTSLLHAACALRLIVSPATTTNAPTTVYWIREPSDPQPLFDLRFVLQKDGQDVDDVGLAAANIVVSLGEGNGESRMGKEEVRFPMSGNYVLKAVAGPTFQVIGTSNEVVVSPPGTSATSTSSKPTATQTNDTGSAASPKPKSKAPIIIGAVLGSLALLLLIALLLILLLRRRKQLRDARTLNRLSFHPEDMVQRRRSKAKAKWVSRLSLRVQAREGGGSNAPMSAPAWGTNGFVTLNGGSGSSTDQVSENPFDTPKAPSTPPSDRTLTFAIPPPPTGAAPALPALAALNPAPKSSLLASIPPSRREQIKRDMRDSDVSTYSQDSPDLEAAIAVPKNPNTTIDDEEVIPTPRPKRRSGAWTLVEQALANVKRRASMVSRSSTVIESRVASPLPGPVSASPYITSFPVSTTASPSIVSASPAISRVASTSVSRVPSTTTNSNGASRTATPKPDMAERAGKRISVLPPVSTPAAPPQAVVRALPPVPLGPSFDAVSVLSASSSMRKSHGHGHKRDESISDSETSVGPASTIESGSDEGESGAETEVHDLTDKERDENVAPLSIVKAKTPKTPSFPKLPPPVSSAPTPSSAGPSSTPPTVTRKVEEAMSEKLRGKQRSNSIMPLRSAPLSGKVKAMETIPASPATTSGSGEQSTVVAAPVPSTPVPAVTVNVVPAPVIPAPAETIVPATPIVKRPLPTPVPKTPAAPASATLRALPPLPPTPATAAPYTPSFPVPQIPSFPETPKTASFPFAHPAPLTPGFVEGDDVPRTPVSASVVRTPSYTRDTVPPVLRVHTKRQRHIEHRIGQVKVQLRLLRRKMESKQVDEDVGRRVVSDLEKQLAWLELHLYGDWANEVEGAERPEEWGRYMRP